MFVLPDPLCTLRPDFFLPDRDGVLEGVDGEPAGLEGLTAVRGRRGDGDANIPNLEGAEPVGDGDPHTPPFGSLRRDAGHFLARQGLVGFVLEMIDLPAPRVVANDAQKQHQTSGARMPHGLQEGLEPNRFADQINADGAGGYLPAADRSEERDLVTFSQTLLGRMDLIVDGDRGGAHQRAQRRVLPNEEIPDVARARAVGHRQSDGGGAHGLAVSGEETDGDVHGNG